MYSSDTVSAHLIMFLEISGKRWKEVESGREHAWDNQTVLTTGRISDGAQYAMLITSARP